ncbi:hypothetical protein [Thiolapillus brandeum]|uniref:Uncharacterized protein n=1 Tax=Thiolapillus brandeum TaxID=1076588 RepID=A0A7U6GGD5_9GAMM|nr:hypothetical protein [Thiolapillus brandeum]BAO43143.1 conserved hypothetical protein [Thiolapillus brandeum]
MKKTIDIPLELFDRLAEHAQGFEGPSDVIERLLDVYEKTKASETKIPKDNHEERPLSPSSTPFVQYGKLDIQFYPPDLVQFKAFLLRKRRAWVLLHKQGGVKELHEWHAYRFTERSDVLGNLRSGYLRSWREKGIVKAEIAIDKSDLSSVPSHYS